MEEFPKKKSLSNGFLKNILLKKTLTPTWQKCYGPQVHVNDIVKEAHVSETYFDYHLWLRFLENHEFVLLHFLQQSDLTV